MKGQKTDDAPPQTERTTPVAVKRSRGGLKRFTRAMGMSCLAVLAFTGGFAAFSIHVASLRTPADPATADAIIVLTGGEARLDAAVELLRSGKGQRLLISGVNPVARLSDLQLATGADPNLFSCCVDIDRAALDTIGNAEESAKWIDAHAYGEVILVTNNYHMPRSMLEMRRRLTDAELLPYPVVNSPLGGGEWMTEPDALRVLFTEYMKYLAAVARGFMPASNEQGPLTIDASAAGVVTSP